MAELSAGGMKAGRSRPTLSFDIFFMKTRCAVHLQKQRAGGWGARFCCALGDSASVEIWYGALRNVDINTCRYTQTEPARRKRKTSRNVHKDREQISGDTAKARKFGAHTHKGSLRSCLNKQKALRIMKTWHKPGKIPFSSTCPTPFLSVADPWGGSAEDPFSDLPPMLI